jgi:Flp pilus assembly protein TadD
MRKWIAPAAVVAVAVIANLNLLFNGFVYDDGSQILHNPWLRDPASIPRMFSSNVWGFMGPDGISNYYRPMMHLVNMACFRLFELNAWGYHLTSILIHAACTFLVWLVTRRLGFQPLAAFWTALLFSILPIHTEAVAWIAANTELIYSLFVLTAFYLHIRGLRRWAVVLLLPGLLMKETAIMLIPLAAAWEFYRKPEWKSLLRVWPYAIPLAIYFPLRIHALGGMTMASNEHILPLDVQVYSMCALLGKYLWKLLDPLPFNIFYVFNAVESPTDWRFLAGLGATLAVIALGYILWRRGSSLWMACVWILTPLLPVLWIQHVGENVFTERYLYLPSVGYCWLLAALIVRAPKSMARVPVAAILGATLASWYAATTFDRNADWHDDIFLYEKTLITSPESSLIRGNLAQSYLAGEDPERALPLMQQVAREKPLNPVVQVSLGTALAKLGRYEEARHVFERARAIRPDLAIPWYNLGLVSEMEGKWDEAEADYRQSLLRSPRHPDSHQNLGMLLLHKGKFEEAEMHFRACASMTSLGKLFAMMGRINDAEDALRGAVRQDVNDAEALYLLGSMLKGEGRTKEADACFREMRRVLPWSKWRPPAR